MKTSKTEQPSATAIVAKNTTYQLLLKAATVGFSMISFALVARFLSVEHYGEFTLISTIFALIIGFSDLRIEQVVVRDTANDQKQLQRLAFQSSLLRALFSVIMIGLAGLFVWLSDYSMLVKTGTILLFAGVILTSLQAGFLSIVQQALKSYLITLAETIAKIVVVVLIAILVALGLGGNLSSEQVLYGFVLVMFVTSPLVILGCLWWWSVRHLGYRWQWSVDISTLRSLWSQSWPLWLMGLLALIHFRVDVLILSWLKESYDVGIYGLAYRLLDVINTLPPLFIASLFPLFSKFAASDQQRAHAMLAKSVRYMLMLVVVLAGITFVAAPQIIQLFGGAGYEESVTVLRIMCLAMVGSFLGNIFTPYLVAHRLQFWAIYILAASVLVNIVLNVILIPIHSFNGAAWATVVSEWLGVILLAGLVIWRFRVKLPYSAMFKTITAVTIMLTVLWLLGFGQISTDGLVAPALVGLGIGILGLTIYGGLILLLRVIERDVLEQSLSLLPIPNWTKRMLLK